MLSGLMLTAFLMGVGGIPHCAAMCGAPCAAAFPRGLPWTSLLGRCLGYALMGALAAMSAGAIASWGRQIAFLQPLWVLLLAAAVMLGLYLLRSGQMPATVNDGGQALYRRVRARWAASRFSGFAPGLQPLLPVLAGMLWVVMPCGLLYAALMVAALAPDAWGGALVMLAFAVPGAIGVWAAPAILRQAVRIVGGMSAQGATRGAPAASSSAETVPVTWMRRDVLPTDSVEGAAQSIAANRFDPRWAVRVSGLMLAAMAGWALYHQLLMQWRAWCA